MVNLILDNACPSFSFHMAGNPKLMNYYIVIACRTLEFTSFCSTPWLFTTRAAASSSITRTTCPRHTARVIASVGTSFAASISPCWLNLMRLVVCIVSGFALKWYFAWFIVIVLRNILVFSLFWAELRVICCFTFKRYFAWLVSVFRGSKNIIRLFRDKLCVISCFSLEWYFARLVFVIFWRSFCVFSFHRAELRIICCISLERNISGLVDLLRSSKDIFCLFRTVFRIISGLPFKWNFLSILIVIVLRRDKYILSLFWAIFRIIGGLSFKWYISWLICLLRRSEYILRFFGLKLGIVCCFPLKWNFSGFVMIIWWDPCIFCFLGTELCIVSCGSFEFASSWSICIALASGNSHLYWLWLIIIFVLCIIAELPIFWLIFVSSIWNSLIFYFMRSILCIVSCLQYSRIIAALVVMVSAWPPTRIHISFALSVITIVCRLTFERGRARRRTPISATGTDLTNTFAIIVLIIRLRCESGLCSSFHK